MNKYIAPVLTIAIIAALAGVLYIQTRTERPVAPSGVETTGEAARSSAHVYFLVREGEESAVYAYDAASGTTRDGSNYDGGFRARFNQSSDVCRPYSGTSLVIFDCQVDDRGVLTMRVRDLSDSRTAIRSVVVDPSSLGIAPSAANGYLLPVAVADDKSAIYLGRRVESESWVAGLWKLDVATGKVSEVAYVRDHDLYEYDINPATNELIGATFTPPESLGEWLSGPSELHLVNLVTGEGASLEALAKDYYENPMLSDDAMRYAFHEAGPTLGEGRTVVLPRATGRVANGWEIDGVAKDWFGDTLVFDRGGNLFLYDLKTSTETQITHETDASVEYVGVVR